MYIYTSFLIFSIDFYLLKMILPFRDTFILNVQFLVQGVQLIFQLLNSFFRCSLA